MKPLQQILIISLFTITAHQIDAYSWQDFRNDINSGWYRVNEWFATNITSPIRSLWYKTPGTEEALIIAAREARSEQQARKEVEIQQQEAEQLITQKAIAVQQQRRKAQAKQLASEAQLYVERKQLIEVLANTINQFMNDLILFKRTLNATPLQDIQFIWEGNKEFLKELDSIKNYGMPKSIFDVAITFNQPKLIESLKSAFAFLVPALTWEDLSKDNRNKLLQLPASTETINNLIKHLEILSKKDPYKNDDSLKAYFRWLELQKKQPPARLTLIPSTVQPGETSITRIYLPLLRSYKVSHVLEKLKKDENNLFTALENIKSKAM